MISKIRDGKLTLEIPIVFGMVISENDHWLEDEIKTITEKVKKNLERCGFILKDSYYKPDCEMGTLVIWAELPSDPERYHIPKITRFWKEE